jgi:DivIVA domain-containing protein
MSVMTRAQHGAPASGGHRGFTRVRFREGYLVEEVDDFLEAARLALRRGDGSITSSEVNTMRFTPVRLREGYDMDEVDAELDRLAAALQAVEDARREVPEAGVLEQHQGAWRHHPSEAARPGAQSAQGATSRPPRGLADGRPDPRSAFRIVSGWLPEEAAYRYVWDVTDVVHRDSDGDEVVHWRYVWVLDKVPRPDGRLSEPWGLVRPTDPAPVPGGDVPELLRLRAGFATPTGSLATLKGRVVVVALAADGRTWVAVPVQGWLFRVGEGTGIPGLVDRWRRFWTGPPP